MTRIVILGGGFGGLAVADNLNKWMSSLEQSKRSEIEIHLINASSSFQIGGTFQFQLMDRYASESAYFNVPYSRLNMPHIQYHHDQVLSLHLESHTVHTKQQIHSYTHLVLAMGILSNPTPFPQLSQVLYDICNLNDVLMLQQTLQQFQGGHVVLLVSSKPYKCPPAPYELIFLIHELLSKRPDIRKASTLTIVTPDPTPVPLPNPQQLTDLLSEYGIVFCGSMQFQRIDTQTKKIFFQDEKVLPYDILCGTLPQRAPACLEELCNAKGLIPVDVKTLKSKHQHVYALGDNAHMMLNTPKPKPHPKAGGFAINQAKAVAANIIQSVVDNTPWDEIQHEQKDVAVCYGEVGFDKEVEIRIDLFTNPKPSFQVGTPTIAQEKIKWVKGVVEQWFTMPKTVPVVDPPTGWCC